ncbi:MAG TPA: A/G-specific adenine glycosylase [Treponemataceae bacterium]|nr:A/G-specific adenine glycosylase [Treponemataceae bacterium]
MREFQRTILSYFNEHGRSFPWRGTQDPYEILCSEIMLQQTQTERVVPKYIAWIEEFPTVESLAKATFADVLTLWSGLGYNRRAKFLHDACKTVVEELNGVFPSTASELQKLSGVGPYTSCAVSTFAFNNVEVFIETNIRSLYIFFFYKDAHTVLDSELMSLIKQTLYKDDPRTWYYALMDYGAELKKKVKNPNRKSAHYTKQSKFEGSIRQARGVIIKQLTNANKLSLTSIAENESIDFERILKASQSLVKEGIICEKNNIVYIDNYGK